MHIQKISKENEIIIQLSTLFGSEHFDLLPIVAQKLQYISAEIVTSDVIRPNSNDPVGVKKNFQCIQSLKEECIVGTAK